MKNSTILTCPRCRTVVETLGLDRLRGPLACPACLDDGLAVELVAVGEGLPVWPGDDEMERRQLAGEGGDL